MVEASNVDPRPSVVARFATQGSSIGAPLRHALLELTLVGIGVACRAGSILEVERQNFVCSSAQPGFVTLRAGYGGVGSGKHKTGVLVLRNRVCRAMKIFNGMAILATTMVGRGGELLVMRVLMTIRASCKFDLVDRIPARGRVAFVAGNRRMFSFQRIVRVCVLFHAK